MLMHIRSDGGEIYGAPLSLYTLSCYFEMRWISTTVTDKHPENFSSSLASYFGNIHTSRSGDLCLTWLSIKAFNENTIMCPIFFCMTGLGISRTIGANR
jgi:hypothetical protein